MKKILFIWEGADREMLRRIDDHFKDSPLIHVNDNVKIFQIDEGEIKKVYPGERMKVKLGELEYEETEEFPKKMHEVLAEKRPNQTGIIKVVGEKQKEKDRIEALNTEQKIKPIKIDLKHLSKKEIKKFKKEVKKVSTTKRKSRTRFPKEMEGFVHENLDLKYEDLAEKVNKKFGLDMDSKKMSDYLRYRNIKKEVIYSDDPRLKNKEEKVGTIKRKYKTRAGKYPLGMKGFIEMHMETNSNQALIDLINEKWDLEITMNNVKNYMKYNKLRRVNIIRAPRRKKEQGISERVEKVERVRKKRQQKYPDEMEDFIKENMEVASSKELCILINEEYQVGITLPKLAAYMSYKKLRREKKMGKPRKYTDEVLEFLRENINNFKNKELCEELESRFNIKTDPSRLGMVMSQNKIKRDPKPGVDQEIIDFVMQSKIKNAYPLRDKVIEKFEKNISMTKIREIISKRPKLPGEGVDDEVKRIKVKREEEYIDDDSIDGMDLDD